VDLVISATKKLYKCTALIPRFTTD